MVYLTRRETFNAAHRLFVSQWSEEKNNEMFGKCANKNWHGHNYELFITVKGIPDPDTGFIINVKELSKIIKEHIVDRLDHKNLNMDDIDFIPKDKQATTENLVYWIWHRLQKHLSGCRLHCVKLCETENIYAEYYGE